MNQTLISQAMDLKYPARVGLDSYPNPLEDGPLRGFSRYVGRVIHRTLPSLTMPKVHGVTLLDFLPTYEKYIVTRYVGRGAVKLVYQGYSREDPTKQPLAVQEWLYSRKGIEGLLEQFGGDIREAFKAEDSMSQDVIDQMAQSHGTMHLNGLKDAYFDAIKHSLITVQPFCSEGSLFDFDENIRTGKPLSLGVFLDYMQQISLGLEQMQQAPLNFVCFGDIQESNIFVNYEDGRYVLKLGDWGQARSLNDSSGKKFVRSLGYPPNMAPECVGRKVAPTSKSDIFSLGHMGLTWLTGKRLSGWNGMEMGERKALSLRQRKRVCDYPIAERYSQMTQTFVDDFVTSALEETRPLECATIIPMIKPMLRLDPKERRNPFIF